MELVASVVDKDTMEMHSVDSSPFRDAVIPLIRLSRVVRAFERQTISFVSRSITTESVYVPPVSIPRPYAMAGGCSDV